MLIRRSCFMAMLILLFLASMVQARTKQEKLGLKLFQDESLSLNGNLSCEGCHHPSARFADPDNAEEPELLPVSEGSVGGLFGGRNAPSAAYAGFSPIFHFDGELFLGGVFWDGRASGTDITATGALGTGPTHDPLADQAKGPFCNPVEMALSDDAEVVQIALNAKYSKAIRKVCGQVDLANEESVNAAYDCFVEAIAAYERSDKVTRFRSKFDKFIEEQTQEDPTFDVNMFGIEVISLGNNEVFRRYVGPPADFSSKRFNYDQADGLALFNADSEVQMGDKIGGGNVGGMCYLCHLTEKHMVAAGTPYEVGGLVAAGEYAPLFTDFSYDNLGIPVNDQVAFLQDLETLPIDYGLGGGSMYDQLHAACPGCTLSMQVDGSGTSYILEEAGKFKVPTLRNLKKTPPYGHNGYFATIDQIVHFYNTRDVPGFGWPPAEVSINENADELGNLGLSPDQETKIVEFLETLTDG